MAEITHRFIETNGIKMHIAEQGEGPLVVLCHGFPESWYSWRHQLPELAETGYHAVAPDQRGYGQTDRPEAIEAYNILQLTGDVVGLVHALNEEQAVIVGHDWGAPVAWHCALLRPDIFHAVALLSVPYLRRSWADVRPTDAMKLMAGENQFYQLYFQEPGKAEAELEADIRKTVRMFLYSASGDPPLEKRWRFLFGKFEKLLDSVALPESLPAWLTEQDIDFFTREFERTVFSGRAELVPQHGQVVGTDALSERREVVPACTLCGGRGRRGDHDVPGGLRRHGRDGAQPEEEGSATGRRALDPARAPGRG
jgi:pimeloyl-ACP methyl ester carboxylesterase